MSFWVVLGIASAIGWDAGSHPEFSQNLRLPDPASSHPRTTERQEWPLLSRSQPTAYLERIPQRMLNAHEAWYKRGNAQFALGDRERAVEAYDRALAIEPKYPKAWHNRGVALAALGHYDAAVKSYKRSLVLQGDQAVVWFHQGIALIRLNRFIEAIASLESALDLDPEHHRAARNLGITYFALGRYDEALAAYDWALNIEPDYHQAWNNRGNVLRKLGREAEAREAYSRACSLGQQSDADLATALETWQQDDHANVAAEAACSNAPKVPILTHD